MDMDDDEEKIYRKHRKRRDMYINAALVAIQECFERAEILSYDDSLEEISVVIASLPCIIISVILSQNQDDETKIDLLEETVTYLSRVIIELKEEIKKNGESV